MPQPKLPPKDERLRIAKEILDGLITDRYRVLLQSGQGAVDASDYDGRIAAVEAEIKTLES